MSDVPHARHQARSALDLGRSERHMPTVAALTALTALTVSAVTMIGCSEGSLDRRAPARTTTTTSGGDSLPVLDTGAPPAADEGSSGAPELDDDPRLCPADCRITLPVDWRYEGAPRPALPPAPSEGGAVFEPVGHLVPVMLRDPDDGSLLIAEQYGETATLHQLDADGTLAWNIPLPLPCDACDLTHVARHPSGDLLLSATGRVFDGGLELIGARFDPRSRTLRWVQNTAPFQPEPLAQLRSGQVTALPDGTVVQLYLETQNDFNPLQSIRLVAYDPEGTVVEFDELLLGLVMERRRPLIAHATVDGRLAVGIPGGDDVEPFGLIDHVVPPLWNTGNYISSPVALDAMAPDERGHSIELGHTFDGARLRLVLADRAALDPTPRWVATLAFPSSTPSQAAMARDREGELYAAVRTTPAASQEAEPLVGLSLARWTPGGELRWRTTVLERIASSHHPVELAVDRNDGLVVATVIDGHLRVERRRQECACG